MADKEYIDREAFFYNLTGYAAPEMRWNRYDIRHKLDEMPAADVVEVRHAYWKTVYEDLVYWATKKCCSDCGKPPYYNNILRAYILSDYCPNCGAKMDGKGEGE